VLSSRFSATGASPAAIAGELKPAHKIKVKAIVKAESNIRFIAHSSYVYSKHILCRNWANMQNYIDKGYLAMVICLHIIYRLEAYIWK
jgi:hypothetical protein